MTLYSNFSGNVFADNSWNCLLNFCFQRLLKTATYCCQTERQIQRDAWGSAHTERVAQQCMHANCLQIIHKKQWPPNFPNLNPLQISCLGSDTRSLEKIWKNFLQNKAVLSVRKRLWEYASAGGRLFEHLLLVNKVFTFTAFVLVLNALSVRQLLITSKRQVPVIRSSVVFVNSVHNAIKLSIFATNWTGN